MRLVSIVGSRNPGGLGDAEPKLCRELLERPVVPNAQCVCLQAGDTLSLLLSGRCRQSCRTGWAFEARRGGGGSISWPIGQRHALFAGYSFENRNAYDGISEEVLSAASFGNFASSYAGYQYANLRGYQRSVKCRAWVTASVVSRYFSKAFGATFEQVLMRTAGQLFVNNPLFDNHVLTMRVASAFSLGPEFKERFRLGRFRNSSLAPNSIRFIRSEDFQVRPVMCWKVAASQRSIWSTGSQFGIPSAASESSVIFRPLVWGLFHGFRVVFSEEMKAVHCPRFTARRGMSLSVGRMSVGAEIRGRIAMGWAYWIIPRLSISIPVMTDGRFTGDISPIRLSGA